MRFRKLLFNCFCGMSATEIRDVGLTPQHELVVRWECSGCKQQIYVVKRLADCWRECAADGPEESPAEMAPFVSDELFLKTMRVKWPER